MHVLEACLVFQCINILWEPTQLLQVLLLSWWLKMQWTVRVDSAAYGESNNLNTRPYISTHLMRTYTNPGSKVNGISTKKLNKLHSQGVDEGTQQGGNRVVKDPTRLGRRKALPGGEVKYPFKIATSLNFHHQENSGGRITAYHIQWMAANRTWDEVYAGENAMVVEAILQLLSTEVQHGAYRARFHRQL